LKRAMSASGPPRHLMRRSEMSRIGGEAEVRTRARNDAVDATRTSACHRTFRSPTPPALACSRHFRLSHGADVGSRTNLMCCDVRVWSRFGPTKADLKADIQANVRTDHEIASVRSRIPGIECNRALRDNPLETACADGFKSLGQFHENRNRILRSVRL